MVKIATDATRTEYEEISIPDLAARVVKLLQERSAEPDDPGLKQGEIALHLIREWGVGGRLGDFSYSQEQEIFNALFDHEDVQARMGGHGINPATMIIRFRFVPHT